MRPFSKSKLLKSPDDSWKLENPEWDDEDTLSFYIPTWFNPDEYIDRINVNTLDNDDWINMYLIYYVVTDVVKLVAYYYNDSSDHSPDFDFEIKLNAEATEFFKKKIHNEFKDFVDEGGMAQ